MTTPPSDPAPTPNNFFDHDLVEKLMRAIRTSADDHVRFPLSLLADGFKREPALATKDRVITLTHIAINNIDAVTRHNAADILERLVEKKVANVANLVVKQVRAHLFKAQHVLDDSRAPDQDSRILEAIRDRETSKARLAFQDDALATINGAQDMLERLLRHEPKKVDRLLTYGVAKIAVTCPSPSAQRKALHLLDMMENHKLATFKRPENEGLEMHLLYRTLEKLKYAAAEAAPNP